MKFFESFETYKLNEIGEANAKAFKYTGPNSKKVEDELEHILKTSRDGRWSEDKILTWKIKGDSANYECEIKVSVKHKIQLSFGKPGKRKKIYKGELTASVGFYVDDSKGDGERTTNFGEQYRILATVVNITIDFINNAMENWAIEKIYMVPKADDGEVEDASNKRGRFYEAYIRKQIKRIKKPVSVAQKKIRTKDGGSVGGFVLTTGHSYSHDTDFIKNKNESIVNEIGDRSVEPGMWLQSKYEPNHKGYSFVTKDEERYYAYFEKKPWKWLESQGFAKYFTPKTKAWETSFGHLKGHMHGYGGELDFKSATNKGSHFEILSTYAEIMEDFLANNKSKVDVIIAKPEKSDAKDSRRLRLYQAFLEKTNIFKKVETISVFGQDVIILYPK